jgi:hypothetical protein
MDRERPAILARLVARGVAKYLLSRELEKKAEEKGGELAGFLTARLANLAGNELERADTRGWSLLPDRISMARVRLPAGRVLACGSRRSRLERRAAGGARPRPQAAWSPGSLALLSQRVWEGEREVPLRGRRGSRAGGGGRRERRTRRSAR